MVQLSNALLYTQDRRSVRPRSSTRSVAPITKRRKRKSSVSPPLDASSVALADGSLPAVVGVKEELENSVSSMTAAIKVEDELVQDGGMELLIGGSSGGVLMGEGGGGGIEDMPIASGSGVGDASLLDDVSRDGSMLDDGSDYSGDEASTSAGATFTTAKFTTKFKCPHCPKVCIKAETLTKHLNTHKQKGHKCSRCTFVCDTYKEIARHRKTHMNKMCPSCDFSTNRSDSLKKHILNHQGNQRQKDDTSCTMCDFRSIKPATLKNHMKYHHETLLNQDS